MGKDIKKRFKKKFKNFMKNYGTVLLAIATLIMALGVFYQAEEARRLADITSQQFRPDLMIKINSPKIPMVCGINNSECKKADYIWIQKNDFVKFKETFTNDVFIPLYISIYNLGTMPVKFEKLSYDLECKKYVNHRDKISLLSNITTVIESAKFIEFNKLIPLIYKEGSREKEEDCNLKLIFEFSKNLTKTKTILVKIGE
ncbi:hypothetical protein JW949_03595 [Candidatus Woesearchaeota archaeon]|nr:hypothetical protein [Candidatus Woesearchaeota archaeon]